MAFNAGPWVFRNIPGLNDEALPRVAALLGRIMFAVVVRVGGLRSGTYWFSFGATAFSLGGIRRTGRAGSAAAAA